MKHRRVRLEPHQVIDSRGTPLDCKAIDSPYTGTVFICIGTGAAIELNADHCRKVEGRRDDLVPSSKCGSNSIADTLLCHSGRQRATPFPTQPFLTATPSIAVLAHCPSQDLVCVGQVGDGLVAVQKRDGVAEKLSFTKDGGRTAGEVVFLNSVTSRDWWFRVCQFKLTEPPQCLAVMIDGVADDVLESERIRQPRFWTGWGMKSDNPSTTGPW